MSRPLIGIVGRSMGVEEEGSTIYVFEDARRSILLSGGTPFLILPPQNLAYAEMVPKETPKLTEEEKLILKQSVDLVDGLFLPGGTSWREYDFWIVRYALDKNIPILGVCMGMQLLSKIDNQNHFKDVPSTIQNEGSIIHRQKDEKYVHFVDIRKDTLLYQILGKERIRVNSLHNYHIPEVSSYKINAIAEDGLIEGVEDPSQKFVLGVQWHPEKMVSYDEDARKILSYFIERAKEYQIEKIAIKEKL